MSRPEEQAPPEIFYNANEAVKYSENSHTIDVQTRLTNRAIELALLSDEKSCLVLDIGCGSGISGSILSERGHQWIGMDISPAMLDVAVDRQVDGDLLLADFGQLHRFRPGSFDAAISVSAIQWLCNADKAIHSPFKRLTTFFKWLRGCLAVGARAVFQFYPDSPAQAEMITSAALRSGFTGGLIVDYPNSTRAKKYFLTLWAGVTGAPVELPKGLTGEEEARGETAAAVSNASREKSRGVRKKVARRVVHDKEWIQNKKESQRRKKMRVRPDSRYTGRRRKHAFG